MRDEGLRARHFSRIFVRDTSLLNYDQEATPISKEWGK